MEDAVLAIKMKIAGLAVGIAFSLAAALVTPVGAQFVYLANQGGTVSAYSIGSRLLMESRSTDRETLIRRTLQAGTSVLRPETYARFDLHCVFNKLGHEALKDIAAVQLEKSLKLINSQGHSISVEQGGRVQ